MGADERLRALGIDLSTRPTPVANYVPAVRTGNLLFLSGHGPPPGPDGKRPRGKAGKDLDVEEAYAVARQVAVALLSTIKGELGSLDRVRRVVKVLGMVNCTPDFVQQPQVINGASDLLVQVFGEEIGKHARSAIGVGSLPFDIPVEIEMVVEIVGE